MLLSSCGNSRIGYVQLAGFALELYLVRINKTGTMRFAMGRRTVELAITADTIALDAVDAPARADPSGL